ncbi:MAG TPA: chromate efflux transporter, partial [Polyangiaceae bacterium]|nr:chromate efflux transporter [Polyangiaceae bacterium]
LRAALHRRRYAPNSEGTNRMTGPPVGATREADPIAEERTTLRELCLLFLRLGATAFGGPAVHIAMMQDEIVRRRRWLTEERFLDLLGATNLIPGPNSTEMAIHIGWDRRRWAGLVIAGTSFIVPAMLITATFGWAYVRYASVPAAAWLLYGIKPVILAVVVQAIWGLAPKAARTVPLRVLGGAAAVSAAVGVNELIVLFGAGAAAILATRATTRKPIESQLPMLAPAIPVTAAATAATAVTLPGLFWVFFKVGSVLFGSGYVLLAFLRDELVQHRGWLTEGQLVDAIAVGQVTPGPVFTTATFIGYVLAGPGGALLATAGIFLPAFIFVALSGPLVPRLRASPLAASFLDGVNVASLALMLVVTFQLARAAVVDVPTAVLLAVAAVLLVRFKLNATWLVLGGGLSGWVVAALRG